MKTNEQKLTADILSVLPSILESISHKIDTDCIDPYDQDAIPSIQITVSCDSDLTEWNYQYGDNSYIGSCYELPYWGVSYITKDANFKGLTLELIEDMLSQIY